MVGALQEEGDIVNKTKYVGLAPYSCVGEVVDILAPGSDIVSTAHPWIEYETGWPKGYAIGSGTSYASPLVAGLFTMMLNFEPTLSWQDLKSKVLSVTNSGEVQGAAGEYGILLESEDPLTPGRTIPVIDAFAAMATLPGFLEVVADVDSNGLVEQGDLQSVTDAKGDPNFAYLRQDINGDGRVDSADEDIVNAFLSGCPICNEADPGQGYVRLISGGSLNGVPIDGTANTVSVSSGVLITGGIRVQTENLMGPSAVAPLVATVDWGNRQTQYWYVSGTPAGISNHTIPVSIQAPTAAGEYHLILSFAGRYSADQVMSSTAAYLPAAWNDGNDVGFDWCAEQFAQAEEDGRVCIFTLHGDGFAKQWQAATAVRVVVAESPSPEMVAIPESAFTMGDPWSEGYEYELPLHPVTLSPYQIGRYEVTNRQFVDVLNWALFQGRLDLSISFSWAGAYGVNILQLNNDAGQIGFDGTAFFVKTRQGHSMDDHPVVRVTWYGAAVFCNLLSEASNLEPCYDTLTWECDFSRSGYHLPTEAQWEQAAAWDGTRHWRYGFVSDTISYAQANYAATGTNYCNPLGLNTYPYTSPVGYFNGHVGTGNSMSPVGCYDMTGNVQEWCNDLFDTTYYQYSPVTDPRGPSAGVNRVKRGGGWASWPVFARTSSRSGFHPVDVTSDLGFRLTREMAEN